MSTDKKTDKNFCKCPFRNYVNMPGSTHAEILHRVSMLEWRCGNSDFDPGLDKRLIKRAADKIAHALESMSKKAKAEHDALIKAKGPQDEIDAA